MALKLRAKVHFSRSSNLGAATCDAVSGRSLRDPGSRRRENHWSASVFAAKGIRKAAPIERISYELAMGAPERKF